MTLDVTCAHHAPRVHGGLDPFQPIGAQVLADEWLANKLTGERTNHHLIGLCQSLKSGSDVGRFADDSRLQGCTLADDVADDNRSSVDANAHSKLQASERPVAFVEARERVDDSEAGPHSALGVILVCLRVAEIDQHPIAEVLGDITVVLRDHVGAGILIRADDLA